MVAKVIIALSAFALFASGKAQIVGSYTFEKGEGFEDFIEEYLGTSTGDIYTKVVGSKPQVSIAAVNATTYTITRTVAGTPFPFTFTLGVATSADPFSIGQPIQLTTTQPDENTLESKGDNGLEFTRKFTADKMIQHFTYTSGGKTTKAERHFSRDS